MKFVFTKEEVAQALSMTVQEFEDGRNQLEACDFPRPIAGLNERWSIIDVINWVNRSSSQTNSLSGKAEVEFPNRLN